MCTGGESNQGPLGPKSDALSTAPLRPSEIGYRMSKCDIWPKFDGQNGISNVKMRYSVRIRTVNQGFELSKYDFRPEFECLNEIFGPSSNVNLGF